MKTVWATYTDKQEIIQFPVGFLKSEIPQLLVFASDEKEKKYLLSQGVPSAVIDFKITDKYSIATAQNLCVDKVFKELNADFVVWLQADTYPTQEARKLIEDFTGNAQNLGKCIDFKVRHIRLFHTLNDSTHFGCTVIGRHCPSRFVFDGCSVENVKTIDTEDLCVDIGYLSIEQTRRHLDSHADVWKFGEKYNPPADDKLFALHLLERNKLGENLGGIIEEGSHYFDLICRMGLEKEYEKVKEITESLTNKIAV